MLIARAPVRISLAGGGTDLSAYYEQFGGLVVGTAIAKYFYAFIEVSGRPGVQISSADYGTFYHHAEGQQMAWDGDLSLPRAVLHHHGVTSGVDLFLASEIPPGTGLGSSSAATVALVKGLRTLQSKTPSKQELAEEACAVEIEKLAMPIGKQDQYFAAFGGLNAISFSAEGTTVRPLRVTEETRRALEGNLLLFFTGSAHNSSHILSEQREATSQRQGVVVEALHQIKRLAQQTIIALEEGQPDQVGEMLHENWLYKKQLASGITNSSIDESYEIARFHGALGGKITGAGGGGFLMLYCPPGRQSAVTAALEARGLRRMDYFFDSGGARVLVNSGLNLGRDYISRQATAPRANGMSQPQS
jgi:D-glycero-alpha-D-manno-heptose-7-phosphate kinase